MWANAAPLVAHAWAGGSAAELPRSLRRHRPETSRPDGQEDAGTVSTRVPHFISPAVSCSHLQWLSSEPLFLGQGHTALSLGAFSERCFLQLSLLWRPPSHMPLSVGCPPSDVPSLSSPALPGELDAAHPDVRGGRGGGHGGARVDHGRARLRLLRALLLGPRGPRAEVRAACRRLPQTHYTLHWSAFRAGATTVAVSFLSQFCWIGSPPRIWSACLGYAAAGPSWGWTPAARRRTPSAWARWSSAACSRRAAASRAGTSSTSPSSSRREGPPGE